MTKKEKKSKNHDKIQNFIWNRKGKPFQFAALKWAVHGYSWYGGAKYKKWLKEKYGLREFMNESGRVMLEKIPKEERKE